MVGHPVTSELSSWGMENNSSPCCNFPTLFFHYLVIFPSFSANQRLPFQHGFPCTDFLALWTRPWLLPLFVPRLSLVAFRVDHLGAGLAYRPFRAGPVPVPLRAVSRARCGRDAAVPSCSARSRDPSREAASVSLAALLDEVLRGVGEPNGATPPTSRAEGLGTPRVAGQRTQAEAISHM